MNTKNFVFLETLSLKKNVKNFFDSRVLISKIYYVLMVAIYIIGFLTVKPDNMPLISYSIGCLIAPLSLFLLFLRSYNYVLNTNLLKTIYYVCVGTIYTITMCLICIEAGSYDVPFLYELGTIFISNVAGYFIPVLVSLPIKIVHLYVFEPNKFYFPEGIVDNLEYMAYPERRPKDEPKEKTKTESFKYDTFTEIQLEVELKSALREERFEDAEAIKKILNAKHR